MTKRTKIGKQIEKTNLISSSNDKIQMTLNTDSELASGLIIQRLTELYEDPIKATVRETTSNALDAISEMGLGTNGVVELTSPTTLSPVFKVKDNGVGMSLEALTNIYAKYGASTKHTKLNQVGAYGLGAKAPLAYCTEFTVTSVHEGKKTSILVSREEFTNYIQIISEVETDESNGTEISIPVQSKDVSEFEKEISKYKDVPHDFDSKLIIDNVEYTDDNFILITDKLVLLENEDEVVHGRVWLKNDLLSLAGIDFKISYVIGGFKYNDPSEKFYIGRPEIFIELKPGVASFNSSRDAILKNDNIVEIGAKIKSVEFYKLAKEGLEKIYNKISEIEKRDFLSIVSGPSSNRMRIKEDNSVELNYNAKSGNNNVGALELDKNVDASNSNLSFKEMLDKKAISKHKAVTASFICSDPTSAVRMIFVASNKYDYASPNKRLSSFESKASELEATLKSKNEDSMLIDLKNSLTITSSTGALITSRRFINVSKIERMVVYNVNFDEIGKLLKQRKGLMRNLNFVGENEEPLGVLDISFTSAPKEEVEAELANLKIDNIKMVESSEFSKLSKVARKKQKTKSTPVESVEKELQTKHYALQYKDGVMKNLKTPIQNDKPTLVVLAVAPSKLKRNKPLAIANWYSSKTGLAREDFVILFSFGNHTLSDMTILENLGDVYFLDNSSINKMTSSKKVIEKYTENKPTVGSQFFLDNEEVDLDFKLSTLFVNIKSNNMARSAKIKDFELIVEEFLSHARTKISSSEVKELLEIVDVINSNIDKVLIVDDSKDEVAFELSKLTEEEIEYFDLVINLFSNMSEKSSHSYFIKTILSSGGFLMFSSENLDLLNGEGTSIRKEMLIENYEMYVQGLKKILKLKKINNF